MYYPPNISCKQGKYMVYVLRCSELRIETTGIWICLSIVVRGLVTDLLMWQRDLDCLYSAGANFLGIGVVRVHRPGLDLDAKVGSKWKKLV